MRGILGTSFFAKLEWNTIKIAANSLMILTKNMNFNNFGFSANVFLLFTRTTYLSNAIFTLSIFWGNNATRPNIYLSTGQKSRNNTVLVEWMDIGCVHSALKFSFLFHSFYLSTVQSLSRILKEGYDKSVLIKIVRSNHAEIASDVSMQYLFSFMRKIADAGESLCLKCFNNSFTQSGNQFWVIHISIFEGKKRYITKNFDCDFYKKPIL